MNHNEDVLCEMNRALLQTLQRVNDMLQTTKSDGNAELSIVKTVKRKKRTPEGEKKKKSPTAYNLFVKNRSPHVHADEGQNMMQLIAQEWTAMDGESRQTFVDQAIEAKIVDQAAKESSNANDEAE